jgi:hypothetical protein
MSLLSRIIVTLLIIGGSNTVTSAQPSARWYKGNTHTHTINSDGDSTPDEVVKWYREHGYQFVVLTDHNVLTSVEALNALHGADNQFVVIKGEEVTERFQGKPIHINGMEVAALVPPQGGSSVVDVIQRNVDAIRRASGIPSINHPNYGWALTAADLAQVRNMRVFEVFNGHPAVNNLGGGGVPGLEDVWDSLLSRGTLLYGIAVDDAHYFKQPGNPDVPGPGRGWVMVRAPRLEGRTIIEAIERGEFYATTGVELSDLRVTPKQIRIDVKPTAFSKYRIQFIGKSGRVLSEITEPTATYTVRGDEGYVRARVLESNGRMAWIQPIMLAPASAGRVSLAPVLLVFGFAIAYRWRH